MVSRVVLGGGIAIIGKRGGRRIFLCVCQRIVEFCEQLPYLVLLAVSASSVLEELRLRNLVVFNVSTQIL